MDGEPSGHTAALLECIAAALGISSTELKNPDSEAVRSMRATEELLQAFGSLTSSEDRQACIAFIEDLARRRSEV